MAESLTIARPYAEAAFKLAREQNALPSWSDALSRPTIRAGNSRRSDSVMVTLSTVPVPLAPWIKWLLVTM